MNQRAKNHRLFILAACAFILLLSAWIQAKVLAGTEVVQPIRADAAIYVSYAWNMREFGTFSRSRTWVESKPTPPKPDKLTLPGYPLFLSLFLDGKPDAAFVAKATTMQALLGVATCGLVLLIALRLLPVPWALAAALITAISPHLATINTYLLTESLFSFLLAAFVYAGVRAAQSPESITWWVLGAGLLAVASYVRPQLQPLPAVLLLSLAINPEVRKHWRNAAAALLVFCALMAPWQVRNAGIERPQGEADLLATSLYHGGFPDFMYRGNPQSLGAPYRYDTDAGKHGGDVPQALNWIRSEFDQDPFEMTRWYLLGKPVSFLSWNIVAGIGDVFIYPIRRSPYLEEGALADLHQVSRRLHRPLMILGFCAMLLGAVRPRLLAPSKSAAAPYHALSILLIAVLLVHMVGAPFPRYGIPFRWILYLLAMVPLARIGQLAVPRMQLHERDKAA